MIGLVNSDAVHDRIKILFPLKISRQADMLCARAELKHSLSRTYAAFFFAQQTPQKGDRGIQIIFPTLSIFLSFFT
jgi:hypothetical protein